MCKHALAYARRVSQIGSQIRTIDLQRLLLDYCNNNLAAVEQMLNMCEPLVECELPRDDDLTLL